MRLPVLDRPEEGLVLSDRDRQAAQRLEADLLADEVFARSVRPIARRLGSAAPPVVVGVSPDGGLCAVEWAAAEASVQGCRLHVVHAFRAPVVFDPLCMVPPTERPDAGQTFAARRIDAALARARTVAPDIPLSGQIVQGPVARVLLRESRNARLLVLGARRESRPGAAARRILRGSLRARVVTAACCPVTVVHPLPAAAEGSPSPRVVVGVDGTPEGERVVAFAFRAARQRGIAVTAVHAWTADCPADLEALSGPMSMTEAAAHDVVERAVEDWRAAFPDVPVTTEVVRRDPASALLAGSAGAALVVVGASGRGRLIGALFGSVTRTVLAGARGPVTVVQHVARRTVEGV